MGRGKSRGTDKEYSKIQRLAYENKKLKREIARLRNELGRAVDLIEPEDVEAQELEAIENKEKMHKVQKKKDWTCHTCREGSLQFHPYTKFNGETWYYRRCDACTYRTKGKKLTADVEKD